MPKIRGVKPDYWTDDAIVELTIPARLLFIGLWNHACDNGHLQDKSKQIKMRVLPADDVNVAELLRELAASMRIDRADGWITIPNFVKHQRPDRRYFQTCGKPGCARPEGDSQPETRGAPHETTTSARSAPVVGSPCTHGDGDGDGDGERKVKKNPSRSRSTAETPERFEEFWDTYGHKVGRRKAEQKYRLALAKPGVTADLLIASAAAYITWQTSEGKHPTFTKHPATWLNGEHWADERVAREAPKTRVQAGLDLARDLAERERGQHLRSIQ